MTQFRVFSCFTLVAAVIWATAVGADGFRNPPNTAGALGQAGNNRVWIDDGSAVFDNPANLVDVPSSQVQLSTMLGYSHADFSGPLGQTETERPWGLMPAFSFVWLLPETDLALGIGAHIPYGRKIEWDSDGLFPIRSKLSVTDISPALAWRPSESVSIGAGLDVYCGRLEFRQFLPFGPDSRFEADADGYAVGGNAGITWRITPNQRLALTCRTPFDLKFEGDIEADDIPSPPLPPSVPESDVDTTFKFPTIVAMGYGIRLAETFRIEANVEWLQFSRYKTMVIDAGANTPLANALGLANVPQNWDDTFTFGLGAEWGFMTDWKLRAGYLYLQSPTPDNTFAPLALDVDQSVVSLGLGYENGRHGVDLAYALGLFQDRRVGANQQPAYIGTYTFEGHIAALTYTYAF